MKKCPKCQKTVHSLVKYCPQCGFKFKNKKLLFNFSLVVILLSVLFLFLIYKSAKNITEVKQNLVEIESDNNYYDRICYNCKFNRGYIEDQIKQGADADWYSYMCNDFCKNQ